MHTHIIQDIQVLSVRKTAKSFFCWLSAKMLFIRFSHNCAHISCFYELIKFFFFPLFSWNYLKKKPDLTGNTWKTRNFPPRVIWNIWGLFLFPFISSSWIQFQQHTSKPQWVGVVDGNAIVIVAVSVTIPAEEEAEESPNKADDPQRTVHPEMVKKWRRVAWSVCRPYQTCKLLFFRMVSGHPPVSLVHAFPCGSSRPHCSMRAWGRCCSFYSMCLFLVVSFLSTSSLPNSQIILGKRRK